jgi:4-amino-4-deoxy-L-arabinose transferase-like glycosyltransferase
MRRWLPLALAALLAMTLFTGLSATDALDERESRDLVTAYESTHHHDWLSPVYGNEPFFDKPLPGYALEAMAIRALERGWPAPERATREVAVSRFLRALMAAALALAVAQTGTQLFGGRAGWLAGCALASMVGLPLATRADGVQVYATLLSWLGLGRILAVLAGRTRTRGATLVLGWLTLGAAANTGGFLSALWPLGGLALYFVLAKRHRGWYDVDPTAGLLIIVGTCLPWYGLMTAIHGPSFVNAMAWFPYAAGTRGAWWSGLPLALSFVVVASFPWTPLLGAALGDATTRLRRIAQAGVTDGPLDLEHLEHLLLTLALVAGLPIVLYPGPPLTAALPALPAVALLVGRFVDRVLDGVGDPRAIRQATWLLALVGTSFALLGVTLAARIPPAGAPLRLLSVALFLSSWAPLLADLRGARKWAVALFALPVALSAPIVQTRVLPVMEPWLNTRTVAETMERASRPDTPLVLFDPPPASLRQSLDRNLVLRTRVMRDDLDVRAADGAVYAAYRPAREDSARAALAPLGGTTQVLARTPLLVLVRVRPDAITP